MFIMSNYNLLHPLVLSFFSKDLYRDVASSWRGKSLLFLVLLLAVCWIPATIGVHGAWAKVIGEYGKALVDQVPTIEVKNGIAWVDAEQPYYIRNSVDNSVSIILDTTGEVTSLDGTGATFLLTRNTIIIKESDTKTLIYSLSGLSHFVITQDKVRSWLTFAKKYASSLTFLIFLVGASCFRIVQALVFALVGLPLARHLMAPLGYPSLLSVAAISLTPTIIIKTFLELASIRFSFSWLVYLAISLSYFAFAISANSRLPEAGPQDAMPSSG